MILQKAFAVNLMACFPIEPITATGPKQCLMDRRMSCTKEKGVKATT